MRVLSEDELDAIYGGQNVTTLGQVTVTATRLHQTAGSYWQGGGASGFGSDEIGGGGSSCWPSTFTPIKPWDVPSVGKVRCMMDAAAEPGFSLSPNYPVAVVNSWAWGGPDVEMPGYTQLKFTSNSNVSPGPEFTGYSGFTYTQDRDGVIANTVSLFPGGMIAGNVVTGGEARMPDGTIRPAGTNLGSLSVSEHTVLTMGHEAAHQQSRLRNLGLTEAQAEGYGQKALMNYQARKDSIESQCRYK